jgi:hypothetical protein
LPAAGRGGDRETPGRRGIRPHPSTGPPGRSWCSPCAPGASRGKISGDEKTAANAPRPHNGRADLFARPLRGDARPLGTELFPGR